MAVVTVADRVTGGDGELLRMLTFRSNNTTHQPIIEGITLVLRHAKSKIQFFPEGETVPLARIVEGDWLELA